MKPLYVSLTLALFILFPSFGSGIESVKYANLVTQISRPCAPVIVDGRYIIFTASGNARHTAISFEYENYTKSYSFQRLVRKDENNKRRVDAKGKTDEGVLFYIAEIPSGYHILRYRMVIDGLWTTDPLNSQTEYDYDNGMMVSTLPVDFYEVFQTANVNKGQVRFTYEGDPGNVIDLAGSFNDWDPFMYEMTETSPGKYELVLPLPAGTWYYSYFEGTTQLKDDTNSERVYTKDGRVASVVTVK